VTRIDIYFLSKQRFIRFFRKKLLIKNNKPYYNPTQVDRLNKLRRLR